MLFDCLLTVERLKSGKETLGKSERQHALGFWEELKTFSRSFEERSWVLLSHRACIAYCVREFVMSENEAKRHWKKQKKQNLQED